MFAITHGLLATLPLLPAPIFRMLPTTGVTLTGGKVSAVDVGNGLSAIQTTDSMRPTIATVNGFDVFRFNGSCLKIPALTLDSFVFFAVFDHVAPGSSVAFLLEHSANGSAFPGMYIYNNPPGTSATKRTPGGVTTYTISDLFTGGKKVICYRVQHGVAHQFYLNSTTPVAGGGGALLAGQTPVTDTLFIGARNSAQFFFNMDLAMMECYDTLTSAQAVFRMNELMAQYSTL